MLTKTKAVCLLGSLAMLATSLFFTYETWSDSVFGDDYQARSKEVYCFLNGPALIRQEDIKIQSDEMEIIDYYHLMDGDGSYRYIGENISNGRINRVSTDLLRVYRTTDVSSMDRTVVASLINNVPVVNKLRTLGIYNYRRTAEKIQLVDIGIAGMMCYLKNSLTFHCSLDNTDS